jgi:3-oxoacyl-[acyl-carrier-protein] synthase-3
MEAGRAEEGLLWAEMGNDGAAAGALMVPNFGTSMDRIRHDMLDITVQFDGREIFRRAVKGMTQSALSVLAHAGRTIDDVQIMIPHQANRRIIDAAGSKLGIDPERVYVNVDRFGNTSAASIPIALAEAMELRRIGPGDLVLFTAFGAGLSRGAALLRWGPRTQALGRSAAELPPCAATGLELIRRHADPMLARKASRAGS